MPLELETLEYTDQQAVELCREIEPFLAKIGYHCALTGGCLFRGSSTKDFDVIVYPHKTTERLEESVLIKKLESIYKATTVVPRPHEYAGDTKKVVAMWNKHGYRTDFILWP